ncbi:hypothetical protein JA1_002728 [Spathaspora sp. JA1]|nr:hypothetical protein JA1_002728 [Spathaspora sp. JA1]
MKTREDKVKFRNHFLELGQGRIISNEEYWCEFWRYGACASDIYDEEVLTFQDVRKVRNLNKINFILLVRTIVDKIITSDVGLELLNCVRLLTKLLPFIFEVDHFETVIFWTDKFDPIEYIKETTTTQCSNSSPGDKLLSKLISLLFIENFTITSSKSPLWEPGIGSNQPTSYSPPNLIIDCNRIEILKLVISLCSNSMYEPLSHLSNKGSKFLTYLVTNTPKQQLLYLVCSLINVVCRASHPDKSALVYQENVNFTETRHLFITCSIQLLTLLVIYPIPSGVKGTNMARSYMGRIHKDHELSILASSLITILTPTNQPSPWATEAVMLVWELIQCNKKFRHLIEGKFMSELMVTLMYYPVTFHSNRTFGNLVRVSVYLILYLTSLNIDELFFPMSSSLYETLPNSYKLYNHPLTTRDFLICQICNCMIGKSSNLLYIASNKEVPDLLAKTIVEILYNLIQPVSPYQLNVHNDPLKKLNNPNPNGGISYPAANSIIHLINKLSTRQYLLETPFHSTLLALVIRAITTTVITHPQPSRMVLFCMLKNENMFNQVRQTLNGLDGVHFKQGVAVRIDDTPEVIVPDSIMDPEESLGIARPINRDEPNHLTPDEIVAESLRPTLPRGMTHKAREKQRKNLSLKKSWGGGYYLKLIVEVIIPKLHQLLDDSTEDEILKLVQLIETVQFDQTLTVEMLCFTWNHLALSWYISLLYFEIYNSSDLIKNCIKTIQPLLTTTRFKWNLLKWEEPNDIQQYIKNNLTNTNHWTNSNIKLFKIEQTNDSLFNRLPSTPNLTRRFTELSAKQTRSSPVLTITDSTTPIIPKRPVTRPSIVSLQSLNKINRTRSNTTL